MPQETYPFLYLMQTLHEDSSRLQHFARNDVNDQAFSTMPVTPFVYQFFLYNSIYQVNWRASTNQKYICFYGREVTESWQQRRLEYFIRQEDPSGASFIKCFDALRNVNLTGEWTEVIEDDNITLESGEVFFDKLRELQIIIRQGRVVDTDRLYCLVDDLRYFIYKVRNNIFHGVKTLHDIDRDALQKQRIDLYYLTSFASFQTA